MHEKKSSSYMKKLLVNFFMIMYIMNGSYPTVYTSVYQKAFSSI
jgi:hypothetical protein